MSENRIVKLNRMPAITWYWLNMNETSVEISPQIKEAAVTAKVPAAITVTGNAALAETATGSGRAMSAVVDESGVPVQTFTAAAGVKEETPVRLKFSYENGMDQINAVDLVVADNAEMTVIMDYTSEAEAAGSGVVRTRLQIGENALLKLVQIERVGKEFTFVNDLGGRVAESGNVEIIHLFLSGKKTCQGSRVDLEGKKSFMKLDVAYRLQGEDRLDMNYEINHIGKKTECEIAVNGVLRDRSTKVFRGTIDLRKGASGAVGNEKEDVLLMDDDVHCETIPVILCSEEDVVGNHGATIGRLDEDLMFYMESRGMNREEIYEMMAGARIMALVKKIPDAQTREELIEYLGGNKEDDEE